MNHRDDRQFPSPRLPERSPRRTVRVLPAQSVTTSPATIRTRPATRAWFKGRSANPSKAKWSISTDASSCPAITLTMKLAAPSFGASSSAAVKKRTPPRPPIQIHQGPLNAVASEGSGSRKAIMTGMSTATLMRRETIVAQSGCPSRRPSMALAPACTGTMAPASSAATTKDAMVELGKA